MRERNVCDMLGIHSSLLSCVREREMKQVEKKLYGIKLCAVELPR